MARTLAFLALLLASLGQVFALDPTSRISQYGHSVWRVQDGYFGGEYSISPRPQTATSGREQRLGSSCTRKTKDGGFRTSLKIGTGKSGSIIIDLKTTPILFARSLIAEFIATEARTELRQMVEGPLRKTLRAISGWEALQRWSGGGLEHRRFTVRSRCDLTKLKA